MADIPKPLVAGANQYESVKTYQEYCAQEMEDFQPNQTAAVIFNCDDGDGRFQINYIQPDGDHFCTALINPEKHRMEVRIGSNFQKRFIGNKFFPVSENEVKLEKSLCGDHISDLRLAGKEGKYPALDTYLSAGNKLFQKHLKSHGLNPNQQIDLTKIRVVNPKDRDGEYSLLYVDPQNDFFCEGLIHAYAGGEMTLRSGSSEELSTAAFGPVAPIDGVCQMTRDLLEKEEPVTCRDHRLGDKIFVGFVGSIYPTLLRVDLLATLYNTGKWSLSHFRYFSGIKPPKNILFPVQRWVGSKIAQGVRWGWRSAAQGINQGARWAAQGLSNLTARLLSAVASTTAETTAVTTTGEVVALSSSTAAAEVGAVGTVSTVAGTSATAAGGTTAAVTTAGAAGAGTVALAATAAFAAGFAVGSLIEYVPRWLGAKKSVSDGIAWGLEKTFGEADRKGWLVSSYDWITGVKTVSGI